MNQMVSNTQVIWLFAIALVLLLAMRSSKGGATTAILGMVALLVLAYAFVIGVGSLMY